jgi:hypothetical protein
MTGVLGIVIGVVGILGAFAWIIVAISVVQLLRLAPKGQKVSVYGKLGWWKFDDIRSIVGPAADPHIRAMKRGGIAFVACVVLGMGLGFVLGALPKT